MKIKMSMLAILLVGINANMYSSEIFQDESDGLSEEASFVSTEIENDLGSLLLKAVKQGDVKSVDEYLREGTYVNTRDNSFGMTPLMLAVMQANSSVVKRLLQEPDIDINARDFTGFTALMCAKLYEATPEDRANPFYVDYYGYIIDLLLKAGAEFDQSDMEAVENAKLQIVPV